MYPTIMTRLSLTTGAAIFSILALTAGCAAERGRAEPEKGASRLSVKTQPFTSEPCGWVTRAEVESLMGQLKAEPGRGRSAENPTTQEGGKACVYQMAHSGPGNEVVALQVDLEDALVYQTGDAMASGILSTEYRSRTAPPEGWDYFSEGPGGTVFRLGHMAVIVAMYTPKLFTGEQQTAKAAALAALVRDQVPDLPVAAERGDPNAEGWGPDPCALITREEAEAVLGKLPIPPYRSQKFTPFADGAGQACTYYRGKHRVLVLTPHWSDGRETFGLASGLTEQVTSNLGVGEQSADTLEGPWDESKADMDGTLNFLVGDRMLEMIHGMAGIDASGALRLAATAVERLRSAR